MTTQQFEMLAEDINSAYAAARNKNLSLTERKAAVLNLNNLTDKLSQDVLENPNLYEIGVLEWQEAEVTRMDSEYIMRIPENPLTIEYFTELDDLPF